MKNFFNEYKWRLIIVFAVPLGVSYIWFIYDGFIPIGNLDKSNWLSFWGSFLAFYGTFFLGIVAIWQNKQAGEQNKRLLDIEYIRHSCNVILEDTISEATRLPNENGTDNSAICDMRFMITNHGDAILKQIQISFLESQVFSSHMILAKGEKKNVIVRIPRNFDCEKRAQIFFISCNGITTYGSFDVSFIGDKLAQIKHYHFYGLQKEEAKK
jgi:hypothetical protein